MNCTGITSECVSPMWSNIMNINDWNTSQLSATRYGNRVRWMFPSNYTWAQRTYYRIISVAFFSVLKRRVFNFRKRFLTEFFVITIFCKTCMPYQFYEDKSMPSGSNRWEKTNHKYLNHGVDKKAFYIWHLKKMFFDTWKSNHWWFFVY